MKMSEIKHQFASNLVKLRKAKKMNQQELGEAIHYSFKAISKWENEETMPDIEVLTTIAEYFGVTVDELISSENILRKTNKKRNRFYITLSSALLPYFVALLVFAFLYIFSVPKHYICFSFGAMASAITLIVFTSLWYDKPFSYISVVYLIFATGLSVLLLFDFAYWWIILLIAIALSILFFVFFKIRFYGKPKNK